MSLFKVIINSAEENISILIVRKAVLPEIVVRVLMCHFVLHLTSLSIYIYGPLYSLALIKTITFL